MIAQQQEERFIADQRAGAPDRVAVAFGLRLNGETQALFQIDQASRLFLGPVDAAVGRAEVCRVISKVIAIDGFVARCGDDVDFLDSALERFLGDDLEHGLGEPVAVDERKHRFLHGVRRRILPRPAAGRCDHRLRYLHPSRSSNSAPVFQVPSNRIVVLVSDGVRLTSGLFVSQPRFAGRS